MLTYTIELKVYECWCGLPFAVPARLMRFHCEDKGHVLFCPHGHQMILAGKPLLDQIIDLKATITQKNDAIECQDRVYMKLERSTKKKRK